MEGRFTLNMIYITEKLLHSFHINNLFFILFYNSFAVFVKQTNASICSICSLLFILIFFKSSLLFSTVSHLYVFLLYHICTYFKFQTSLLIFLLIHVPTYSTFPSPKQCSFTSRHFPISLFNDVV